MVKDRKAQPDEAVSITSAREALSDDIARRNTRYLWQMGIRFLCFVGAVVIDHWTRWILVAGAVILPYVAVVLANAGSGRRSGEPSVVEAPQLPSGGPPRDLGARPAGTTQPPDAADRQEGST